MFEKKFLYKFEDLDYVITILKRFRLFLLYFLVIVFVAVLWASNFVQRQRVIKPIYHSSYLLAPIFYVLILITRSNQKFTITYNSDRNDDSTEIQYLMRTIIIIFTAISFILFSYHGRREGIVIYICWFLIMFLIMIFIFATIDMAYDMSEPLLALLPLLSYISLYFWFSIISDLDARKKLIILIIINVVIVILFKML